EGYTTQDANGNWVLRFNLNGDPDEFDFDVYYPYFENNAYYWAQDYVLPGPFTAEPMPSWLAGSGTSHSPSQMVFANNGVFNDSGFRHLQTGVDWSIDDRIAVIADLENQIVSALNRGVSLLPDWADAAE